MAKLASWIDDLEIHKAIEANRASMIESQKEIILRVLRQHSENEEEKEANLQTDIRPRIRASRQSGKYVIDIDGTRYDTSSYKMTLRRLIETLCAKNPNLIKLLSQHRTPKGRRIVARKPQELYPRRPDLAEDYGEELENGWWFDTNISRNQLEAYTKVICDLASIEYGSDVTIRYNQN